jgi:hypothetical protein
MSDCNTIQRKMNSVIDINVTDGIDTSITYFTQFPQLLELVKERRIQMVNFMKSMKVPKLTTILNVEGESFRIGIMNMV